MIGCGVVEEWEPSRIGIREHRSTEAYVGGGVWEGAELERRCGTGETGRGDASWWVGDARSPLSQAGQFQPMVEPAAQILRKSARIREEQEKCTHLEQVEYFSESFPTS